MFLCRLHHAPFTIYRCDKNVYVLIKFRVTVFISIAANVFEEIHCHFPSDDTRISNVPYDIISFRCEGRGVEDGNTTSYANLSTYLTRIYLTKIPDAACPLYGCIQAQFIVTVFLSVCVNQLAASSEKREKKNAKQNHDVQPFQRNWYFRRREYIAPIACYLYIWCKRHVKHYKRQSIHTAYYPLVAITCLLADWKMHRPDNKGLWRHNNNTSEVPGWWWHFSGVSSKFISVAKSLLPSTSHHYGVFHCILLSGIGRVHVIVDLSANGKMCSHILLFSQRNNRKLVEEVEKEIWKKCDTRWHRDRNNHTLWTSTFHVKDFLSYKSS